MYEFLMVSIKLILAYCLIGFGFFCFMMIQGFWKTRDLGIQIFYSFFWPVSVVVIYIALKKKKEARDAKNSQ